MHTSSTPRFLISVNTCSQYLAPSPPVPTHKPRMSRLPSTLTPIAAYTGRLATWPSRIFTTIASMNTTGYTRSSGRFSHSASSPSTRSVIFEIVSREIDVEYTSARWALDLTGRQAFRGERDDHRVDPVEPALTLADRLRLERPVTIAWVVDHHRADLGDHCLRASPVTRVATVAAVSGVLRVTEMLFHLDFEAGLEDLLGQIAQQTARAHQAAAIGTGLLDELLRERPIRALLTISCRRRHRHILHCHHLSFPASNRLLADRLGEDDDDRLGEDGRVCFVLSGDVVGSVCGRVEAGPVSRRDATSGSGGRPGARRR
jgi:hypothetical protein